jgi:hypothetical protein
LARQLLRAASAVESLLVKKEISLGKVLRQGEDCYSVQIASPKSCVTVAKLLESLLKTVTEYYENRIDGTEALVRINEAIIRGTRESDVVAASLPVDA